MDVSHCISSLTDYAAAHGLIEADDRRWAYNRVLEAIGETGPGPSPAPHPSDSFDLQECLNALIEVARGNGIPAAQGDGRQLAAHLMDLMMPRPTQVAQRFADLLAENPTSATSYFYRLCGDADYIRRSEIEKDITWTADSPWGVLEMTINLSKPEKDPRTIAHDAVTSDNRYPACRLCWENEGYAGRAENMLGGSHPARQNLRIVPLVLGDEHWGLQYSPYSYYAEHCIAINERHAPLRIDRGCFERLLDFVDILPHYFIGSNADLPIVGGSILTHDHFQGGRHLFPLDRAPIDRTVHLRGYESIEAGIVRWPLTVLRLRSADRVKLIDAADTVLDAWSNYSDPIVGIIAYSEGVRHNTITPIAHKHEGMYSLDLALRCNITTPEHPLGVFHPHEDLHHIKKENIGLIEAMGLAILPPRLACEMTALSEGVLTGADLQGNPLTASHAAWAQHVIARHPELNEDNIRSILRDEMGQVFERVLEDAGVFKWDADGRGALERFLAAIDAV